jgi:hypothetical protein
MEILARTMFQPAAAIFAEPIDALGNVVQVCFGATLASGRRRFPQLPVLLPHHGTEHQ